MSPGYGVFSQFSQAACSSKSNFAGMRGKNGSDKSLRDLGKV